MFNPTNMYDLSGYKQGIQTFHDLIIELRDKGEYQLAATFMDLNSDLDRMNTINKANMAAMMDFENMPHDPEDLVDMAIEFGQNIAQAEIDLIKAQPELALEYRLKSLKAQIELTEQVLAMIDNPEFGDEPF